MIFVRILLLIKVFTVSLQLRSINGQGDFTLVTCTELPIKKQTIISNKFNFLLDLRPKARYGGRKIRHFFSISKNKGGLLLFHFLNGDRILTAMLTFFCLKH